MSEGQDVRVRLGVLDPVAESGLFDVVCIRPGEANGVEFSAGVLRDAVGMFEGASVFLDHGGFFEATRSVKDLAGVITQAKYEDGKGITGRMRLVSASEWLEGFLRQLVADRDQGLAVPRVGLSADLYIRRKGVNVEEIRRVNSVDIVFDPAAGGSFERVLNSVGRVQTPYMASVPSLHYSTPAQSYHPQQDQRLYRHYSPALSLRRSPPFA